MNLVNSTYKDEIIVTGPCVDKNGRIKNYVQNIKTRKKRKEFSKEQRDLLESEFVDNHYPSYHELEEIRKKTTLTLEEVKVWFKNRRTKYKRKCLQQKKVTSSQSLQPQEAISSTKLVSDSIDSVSNPSSSKHSRSFIDSEDAKSLPKFHNSFVQPNEMTKDYDRVTSQQLETQLEKSVANISSDETFNRHTDQNYSSFHALSNYNNVHGQNNQLSSIQSVPCCNHVSYFSFTQNSFYPPNYFSSNLTHLNGGNFSASNLGINQIPPPLYNPSIQSFIPLCNSFEPISTPINNFNSQISAPVYPSLNQDSILTNTSGNQNSSPVCISGNQSIASAYTSDNQNSTPDCDSGNQSSVSDFDSRNQSSILDCDSGIHSSTSDSNSKNQSSIPVYNFNNQISTEVYDNTQSFYNSIKNISTPYYNSNNQTSSFYDSSNQVPMPYYSSGNQMATPYYNLNNQSSSLIDIYNSPSVFNSHNSPSNASVRSNVYNQLALPLQNQHTNLPYKFYNFV